MKVIQEETAPLVAPFKTSLRAWHAQYKAQRATQTSPSRESKCAKRDRLIGRRPVYSTP
jgi:hypothetical protein